MDVNVVKEVTSLPTAWQIDELSKFASFYSGGTPLTSKREYYDGDIPWITSGDLNARVINSVEGRISELGLRSSSAKMVKAGTPLIALYGATAGVSAITNIDAAINQAVLAILPINCDARFLLASLQYNKESYLSSFIQSGQPNLSGAIVKSFQMIFPPLSEQRAIAEALSDVDDLIAAQEALIEKKRAIKQGAMQELLTGRLRLPEFAEDWKEWRLDEVADVTMGQSPDSKSYNTVGKGLPLVQGNADLRSRKTISRVWSEEFTTVGLKGDIVMTVRAPVGSIALASSDIVLGRGVCGIRAKQEINPNFLRHLLISIEEVWEIEAQGSTFTSADTRQVKSRSLNIPTDIGEQNFIALVLDEMDSGITFAEDELHKIQALKQGMMQELLTGRIRLV